MPDGHAGKAARESDLPSWDLGDLYPAPESPELAHDLDRAEAAAVAFEQAYAGRLATLSGATLAAAIVEYQRIDEILGRVMSYAQLLFSGDSNDPAIGRFY